MRTAPVARALLALAPIMNLLTLPGAAIAAPNAYVAVPIVDEGEKEIDFKSGVERFRGGGSGSATSLGLGWGASAWWFTELYAKWHHPPGEAGGFDAWEWENRFQLLPTGQYPIDVGVLLEVERPRDRSEGYEITWGPLLQVESGVLQGNLNLLWQRHVRAAEPAAPELNYQWQLKVRSSAAFEWGAQGFGNLGTWDHWAPSPQQQHQAGPAVFGKLHVAPGQNLKYNAALLFGSNHATSRTALRLQAEYEF